MSKISSFLTEYETSLADVRRMMRQMAAFRVTPVTDPPVTPPQPPGVKVLTADEAKQYLNLQLPAPDYLLKITPRNKPDLSSQPGYRLSFITPTDYEIHDDDTVSTPDGQTLSREEFEKQQEAVLKSQLEQYLTSFPDYNRTLPSAGPDPHPEWPTVQEYIDLLYQQVRDVFGKVISQDDIDEMLLFADEDPVGFGEEILNAGRNEDSEALLRRMFPDITEEEIDQVFTPSEETPEEVPEAEIPQGSQERLDYLRQNGLPELGISGEEFTRKTNEGYILSPNPDYGKEGAISAKFAFLWKRQEQPPVDTGKMIEDCKKNGIPQLGISADEFNQKFNEGYQLVPNPNYHDEKSPDQDKEFTWVKHYEESAFIQDYFKIRNWPAEPKVPNTLNYLNLLTPEERNAPENARLREFARQWDEYAARYADAHKAYWQIAGRFNEFRSKAAEWTSYFLPTIAKKVINPDHVDIEWYDPLIDISTIVSLGGAKFLTPGIQAILMQGGIAEAEAAAAAARIAEGIEKAAKAGGFVGDIADAVNNPEPLSIAMIAQDATGLLPGVD